MPHLKPNERSYEDLAAEITANARVVAKGFDEQKLLHGNSRRDQLRKALAHFRNGTILENWDEHAADLIELELEEAVDAETLGVRQEFVTSCWIDEEPTQEGYVETVRDLTERGQVLAELRAAFLKVKHTRQHLLDRIAGQRAVLKLLRKA